MNIDSHSKNPPPMDFCCWWKKNETISKSPLIDFHNEISFLHLFFFSLNRHSESSLSSTSTFDLHFFPCFIIRPERSRPRIGLDSFKFFFMMEEAERMKRRSVRNLKTYKKTVISHNFWVLWMNWWSLNFGSVHDERDLAALKIASLFGENRRKTFNGKNSSESRKHSTGCLAIFAARSLCHSTRAQPATIFSYEHFRNKFTTKVKRRLYRAAAGDCVCERKWKFFREK